MSNFKCLICGTNILEDADGAYVTQCEHYPFGKINKGKKSKFSFEDTPFANIFKANFNK